MTHRLTRARREIRALALDRQPGAIVVAEQAVDLHAALFRRIDERRAALEELWDDLLGMSRSEPDLAPFLAQVGSYIGLLRQAPQMTA